MEYIYKFRSLSECDGSLNHTLELLRENYLYFPFPSQLDDPFECLMSPTWLGIESDPDYQLYQAKAHNLNDMLNYIRDMQCVLSLSKECNNILLWSHYADNHKGICLKFKVHNENETNYMVFDPNSMKDPTRRALPIHEVVYDKKLPEPANLFNVEEQDKFILTKFIKWSYQKEFRIATLYENIKGNQRVKFDKKYLEGIILGFLTKKEHVSRIYEIIRDKYHKHGINVNFYKTEQKPGQYAIKIKKFEMSEL